MLTAAGERFFEAFIDPVDAVLCLPASGDAAAIEREAAPHGLRFPLLADRTSSLSRQVASSPFAPASSRYGGYCDNITGMNWELPDGRRVRVGERVVKSTTGYDLLRFLLASGDRYGRPLDYVLRLRPACDVSLVFRLPGDVASLRSALAMLLRSSWIHWFESVDFLAGETHQIRVAAHCPSEEAGAYTEYLSGLATQFGLSLESSSGSVHDGCPDLVVKTSPEYVIDIALELARQPSVKCVGLCYCGVVHVFLPPGEMDLISELVRPIESALHRIGGDWRSRHLPRVFSPFEAPWIETLRREWNLP